MPLTSRCALTPWRELFVRSFKSVVALSVSRQIIFLCVRTGCPIQLYVCFKLISPDGSFGTQLKLIQNNYCVLTFDILETPILSKMCHIFLWLIWFLCFTSWDLLQRISFLPLISKLTCNLVFITVCLPFLSMPYLASYSKRYSWELSMYCPKMSF